MSPLFSRLSRPARFLATASLVAAMAAVHAAPAYLATSLVLPSGMDGARVWGIQGGVIVGETYSAADFMTRATVWSMSGSATPLADGGLGSAAYAVSNGRIVGYQGAVSSLTDQQAVQWASAGAASPTPIGDPGSGAMARAAAGSFTAGALAGGAFVQSGSSAPELLGNAGSVAYGVSATGIAVGVSDVGAAVVFNGTDAGELAASGTAWAILDQQVVGSYDDASFEQHAFLATLGGGFQDLFSGAAFGLNDDGSVVGADFAAGVAMLYELGQAYDLNSLTSGLDGFTLRQARGIDDDGNIVAFGERDGVERAFLLQLRDAGPTDPTDPTDPGGPNGVPEPGSAALAGVALVLLALSRRRVNTSAGATDRGRA